MSINIVLSKRFEAPPSAEEILALLSGGQAGDINQAKQTLTEILAPMKDLLALFAFTEDLAGISTRQAALLKEQEQAAADLEETKVQVAETKKIMAGQTAKVNQVNQDLAALEMTRTSLSKEIEDEQRQKLMLDQTLKVEYERLRKEMLARLKSEEDVVGTDLKTLYDEIAAAEAKLAETKKSMAELAKGLVIN